MPASKLSSRAKDLAGFRVGKLTVMEPSSQGPGGRWNWLCRCDCGRKIERAGYLLTKAKKKNQPSSCGCVHHLRTHGLLAKGAPFHARRLYLIWTKMRARCVNLASKDYPNYGGRGIYVCRAWDNDFASFYEWAIGNDYEHTLTIERVDVNGHYEPDNCTWVPMSQQSLNWRKSVRYTLRGKTQGMRAWAEEYGINYYTLRSRLRNHGWPIEQALTAPTRR